jgi:cytochrome c553
VRFGATKIDHIGSFKGWDDKKESFLKMCYYCHGQYGSSEDFARLAKQMEEKEGKLKGA